MFSKNVGVERLWPDKDRLKCKGELLEKHGGKTRASDKCSFIIFGSLGIPSSGVTVHNLWRRWLLAGLGTALYASPAFAAPSVTLAWNSDTDPTVIGYNLHYGTSSGNLVQSQDAGN